MGRRRSVKFYGRSRGGHHQHPAVFPENLVIDVDTDHGIGTHPRGAVGHLLHGLGAGLDQFVLIGAGTTADDVADYKIRLFSVISKSDAILLHSAKEKASVFLS